MDFFSYFSIEKRELLKIRFNTQLNELLSIGAKLNNEGQRYCRPVLLQKNLVKITQDKKKKKTLNYSK